jgi:hypothetical protein
MDYKNIIDKVSKTIDDELERQKNLKELIIDKKVSVETIFKSGEIKKECEEQSKNILQFIIFSVLNLDISNELIQKQIQLDVELLTPLLFQYKLSNYMINKITNEIESGDTTPKMFDALSKMQKTNSDNLKDIIGIFQIIEEKYKKIANEQDKIKNNFNDGESFKLKDDIIEISDMRKFIMNHKNKKNLE